MTDQNFLMQEQAFMKRCLELAGQGMGGVSPNPMVGCVITHHGRIIGEGFHRQWGGPHAEIHAIESVKNPGLLGESQLYVNLEPCAHHGKTPPCTDRIIQSGIKEVYYAQSDPNPLVSGKGIKKLKEAGIRVEGPLLEKQARWLNRRFNTFHEKNRPYIILKWAQTADSLIDRDRHPDDTLRPTWITSEKLRMLVHKWRSEEPAIMVGSGTAMLDNPSLNVRDWSGNQPLRLVIDSQLKLSPDLKLFDQTQPTVIFNRKRNLQSGKLRLVKPEDDQPMPSFIMDFLYREKIQSVLIEGGRHLLQTFIDASLWDEARVFGGPVFFGKGTAAPRIPELPPWQIIIGKENFFYFINPDPQ